MNTTWPTYCLPALSDLLVSHFESQRNVYYGLAKSPTLLIEEHCTQNGYKVSNCPAKCVNGFTLDGHVCEVCNGRNFVTRRAKDVHTATLVCPSCNGSGRYWRQVWMFHTKAHPDAVPVLWVSRPNELWGSPEVRPDDLPGCVQCRQSGRIENYNVNPSMQAVEAAAVTDDMLARHNGNAGVSVALSQLQANDQRAALCLELLYGDVGEQASTVPNLGRDFALWPLTLAGSQLIDMGLEERGKAKQQSCALPKPHRVILRQLNRDIDLVKSLNSMAQVGATALRMDAIAKFYTADQQTGGNVFAQLTSGRRMAG